ncbi:hypothetical protein JCM21738_3790 [Mesobacillus boroniphilus JCM 21738]|uniref:PBP domain-containing protein n=1 Tax=Mesobacillus boroniphilus JCM 21738 TaxID=1294265 RepID=W4RRX5_9BACI|nr:hypothetical protein JCM21738_3790 [Mesobacillus boroniphilus JCM 21738]
MKVDDALPWQRDIAAVHLLDPASQQYNLPFIRQLFVHEPITVLRLAPGNRA